MGFNEIFENARKEVANNFKSIITFLLLFQIVPLIILFLILGMFMVMLYFGYSNPNISLSVVSTIGIIVIVLAIIVISIICSVAFFGMPVKTKKYSRKDLFAVGLACFWKYLGRTILLCLILILLFILLIIPGIIFSIYWIFATFIWFNEPSKGFNYSLTKSKQLVQGRWWKTFGYVALIGLLVFVVNSLISSVPIVGQVATVFTSTFAIYFLRHMYIEYSSNYKSNFKY